MPSFSLGCQNVGVTTQEGRREGGSQGWGSSREFVFCRGPTLSSTALACLPRLFFSQQAPWSSWHRLTGLSLALGGKDFSEFCTVASDMFRSGSKESPQAERNFGGRAEADQPEEINRQQNHGAYLRPLLWVTHILIGVYCYPPGS